MKLYFIVGEDSGDLHASNLMKELKIQEPDCQFRGVGGEKMHQVGTELVAWVKDINFMGFWEVITNLKTIRKLFDTVKKDIADWQPDAVVLVDYPGFNLRLAPYLKEKGIPVFYYISPQVWAWKQGRVKKIQKFVDRMFVILPFEKEFYHKKGVDVDFVGHPLLDVIDHMTADKPPTRTPLVALLPGSRKQEIKRMLPPMLAMKARFPDCTFVVAGAPSQTLDFYQEIMGEIALEVRMNQTYDLLQEADYALVTSGTATLETALFAVPEVVCYKGGWISYQIGKRLVKVKFISLVNLILDREVVTELIQNDFTVEKLEKELRLLSDEKRNAQLKKEYQALRIALGDAGASHRTAKLLLASLSDL